MRSHAWRVGSSRALYHVRIVGPELLIILVVVLIFVLMARGPKMLPRIGEALGRTVKSAREEIPSALRDDLNEPPASTESTDPSQKPGS